MCNSHNYRYEFLFVNEENTDGPHEGDNEFPNHVKGRLPVQVGPSQQDTTWRWSCERHGETKTISLEV